MEAAEFTAHDLTSLQGQVDEFVDKMMQQGIVAWVCHYWPVDETDLGNGPTRIRWHCSVFENTTWLRRPVQ